jgi:isoquinoline 1-oxidoreductase subunit beta
MCFSISLLRCFPTTFVRSPFQSHQRDLDPVAAAAKQDAVDYRRRLLDHNPRAKAVLDLAAGKAGWGQALPKGSRRGVSLQFVFGSYLTRLREPPVRWFHDQ